MKKMLMVLAALSVPAMADVTCEKDSRPVDGDYENVQLVTNGKGKTDVYYSRITAGFGFPVQNTKVLIAKNLACKSKAENPVITQCLKSSEVDGEPTNSGVKIELVKSVSVSGDDSRYHVTIYSPQLQENAGTPGFPYMDIPGRVEFEFKAGPSTNSMQGHCVAN